MCVFVFSQELTEEGIPFLILFHVKEDPESLEKFQHEVARQLISEKGEAVCLWHLVPIITHESNKRVFRSGVYDTGVSSSGSINFLHADCEKFRHPLLHIQKTPADCPVIAIDSFRHMYVYPDFKDIK